MSTRVAELRTATLADLGLATLGRVPHQLQPRIALDSLEVGIVHLGLGAFHRAHQAIYTEDAMATSGDRSWAICGVSPRGSSSADALSGQDGLYTLLERESSVTARVVGSLRSVLSARSQRVEVVDRLIRPSTRIVSFTVTEAAYLDPDGVIGLLCLGLAERRRSGGGPVTAMCCDNIPRNGAFLRQRVLAATVGDLALTRWIEANVAFPSCVVDRIVPAPTALDLADASRLIGVRDRGAVSCEGYSQWVMEDDFVAGRPTWEQVGVIFTDHVEPYQLAKLRILNGAHSALAYLGALAGHELIADVLDDDLAKEFVLRLLRDEVVLTLTPPPGVDLNAYAATVLERFRNRALGHRCLQVASDGSQKLPIRLLPTLRARLASGLPARLTILVIAAWMRYVSARHSDDDLPLLVADPLSETIARILHAADEPAAIVDGLLSVDEVFGADLAGDRDVRDELVEWLTLLSKGGARCAMAEALKVGD